MLLPLLIGTLPFRKEHYSYRTLPAYQRYTSEALSRQLSHHPRSKKRPVIIAVHGFAASSFEWIEFKEWCTQHTAIQVSLIGLGGHDTPANLATSRWEDWVTPVIAEYNHLVELGYEHISLCGCSAGATVLLHALNNHTFRPDLPLKHLFLIDTLVETQSKLLYALPYLYPFFSSQHHWPEKLSQHYSFTIRPKPALLELLKLIKATQVLLKQGLQFDIQGSTHIFQSARDPVVNPQSGRWIYNSLTQHSSSPGVSHRFHTLDSNLHIPTRLRKRRRVTPADTTTQQAIFNTIATTVL